MLDDFKPLIVILLFYLNACFLPACLVYVFMDWRAIILPVIPPLYFAIRESRRRARAKQFKYKYRPPTEQTINEYVEMVRKKKSSTP